MEKSTTTIIAVITLIVGLAIGYGMGANNKSQLTAGSHMMPDGQTMNDGSMGGGSHNEMNMQDMMQSMNAALAGKTGDDFDKAFLAEMIVHHQGAVEMATAALINAKHTEIKDLANAIFSAQNKEIAEMKAWQKKWYENR